MSVPDKIIKVVATNRKARHDYDVLDTYETGIVLLGSEIKSVRDNQVSLGEAYVRLEGGEMWLVGAHIARYEAASYMGHDPTRRRKLLLHRKQIRHIAAKLQEKGLTLVPLRMYVKGRTAKLEIGMGRGKKLYDKRDTIQRRDSEREIARTFKIK
ncbi:MAG: SsrA-binding protein SmpB [Dehalococcoidia bacterium]|nr:SsrA-binding protein SmpB [Dehalococcoidia bacterium]